MRIVAVASLEVESSSRPHDAGRRTAQEIRDAVSAIYGPIPLELVVEYLRALEAIKILRLLQ